MSFLAPFFLAAVGAISLPILLHLIRRTPRGKVIFSSLMFLSPTPPRLTKRSSIEHWLLLFLRALAVVLIALAFARPFLWESAAADAEESGPGRRLAILIDTSGSMQREDLWKQALAAVDEALADADPLDEIALLTFDRQVNRLVSRQQWTEAPMAQRQALIRDALTQVKPGHAGTHLGDALITAADLLNETDSAAGPAFTGERAILLVTDLQEGSQLSALDAYDWPTDVRVKLARVTARAATNAGVQIIADRDASKESRQSLRLRIHNAKDSSREQFTLRFAAPMPVAGGDAPIMATPKPMQVYVPPGESRTVRTADLSAWWSPAGNTIVLEGDDHAFDNRAHHSATQPAEAVIVYIGSDGASDTQGLRFYLQLALSPSERLITKFITLTPDQSLPPGETDGASLFIVSEPPAANRVAALLRRAEEGATVLFVLREGMDPESLATFFDASPIATKEAVVRDYAMLSEIDFKHPLFAPFADPRFGDFTTIRFWKHRVIDGEAIKDSRILARFDDGSPALIEAPVGTGRGYILAAGWHPADGQLALSSKFVPLMNTLMQQSLGHPPAASRLVVGDAIDLAWLSNSPSHRGKPVSVIGPDQQPRTLTDDQRITATDQPGIYTVRVGEELMRLAVNQPAGESDTAPLAAEELEKRGVRLWQSETTSLEQQEEHKRQMRMTELENKHKLWRWLIVAALAVLMIETFVAGRSSKVHSSSETTM